MNEPTETGRVTEIEIYRQQSARFQNLNDTLYRIPPIFSTVIGGLWYFSITQAAHNIVLADGILLFAAAVGMAGGNSILRLRLATNGYLDQINAFEGGHAVTLKPSVSAGFLPRVSTSRSLAYLLFFSALLSVAGILVRPLAVLDVAPLK
jgi:hypothetical protein